MLPPQKKSKLPRKLVAMTFSRRVFSLSRRVFASGLFLGSLLWCALATAQTVKVAAAANLKAVLTDIVSQYQRQTGQEIQINYGSSVQLARQIQQGLPVQLFISADDEQAIWLNEQGLTQDVGQRYATGRLAAIALKTSAVSQAAGLEQALLRLPSTEKLAIANPGLAPYGSAARETLQKLGLWSQVQHQLVLGENVGQTTQFVLTGAAPLGITAFSLTRSPDAERLLKVWLLPQNLHAPLTQRLVLLKGANAPTQAFKAHLFSPAAQALFQKHGYGLPQ